MTALPPTVQLQLPWSASEGEDRAFVRILFAGLLVALLLALIMSGVDVPQAPIKLAEVEKKLLTEILIELPEPKPEPERVVEEEPEPVPTAVVAEAVPEPVPEPVPVKAPEPEPQSQQQARNKALQSGLLAMRDELSSLRERVQDPAPAARQLAEADRQAYRTERKLVGGGDNSRSGGIESASQGAVSGDLNLGSKTVAGVGSTLAEEEARLTAQGRSEESIRAVQERIKGALFSIYNRALRKDPLLQGEVVFRLIIEPDGAVSSVTIMRAGLEDPSLQRKLSARLRAINFGPAQVGRTATDWVFDFQPV